MPVPAVAQDPGPDRGLWITLGTHGGPVPSAQRSQPANLLLEGDRAFLVDAGDGTAGQLAKAGLPLSRLSAVFISHLHFDHTGGLPAIIGLRFQTEAPGTLMIYGPPGIRTMVDGILASMAPSAEAGYGVPGEIRNDPAAGVAVVEVQGSERFQAGGMTVSTVENTHYSFLPGSEQDRRFASLSFRFDLPGRSILYTGDTGPSEAVTELGRGADLLVTEMIDIDGLLATMGPARGGPAGGPPSDLVEHLRTHHLTPEDVGRLASAAGVRQAVVTHLVTGPIDDDKLRSYRAQISAMYDGNIAIASDLDGF